MVGIYKEVCLNSPLDQFGNNEFTLTGFIVDLLSEMTDSTVFFELENFISLGDFFSYENIVILFILFGTSVLFDDGAANTGFFDINLFLSNLQNFIFIINVLGMFIGFNTGSSSAAFSFSISVLILLMIIMLGFGLHNIRYFSVLYPTVTPVIVAPFIILIELISFLARVISLGIRLFANMFAGHSLVKILTSFLWTALLSTLPLTGFIIFLLLTIIFFLECAIAYLQSFVFITLCSMYFDDVITLGH